MYAHVLLLNGFIKPFWYKIPEQFYQEIRTGLVVRVPLQKRHEIALVMHIAQVLPQGINFMLKEISDIGVFPGDNKYHEFLEKIARFYFLTPIDFYQRLRHFLQEKDQETPMVLDTPKEHVLQEEILLTHEQQIIIDYLAPHVINPSYKSVLLHGVTGSGKTEVYKRLITQAIQLNKSVVLLLPEVTLALQFQNILQQQLPNITIMGFHSATKINDKKNVWQRLTQGLPTLVIGVHLPIMLPYKHLGLIIIDEEHETGFQEKKHPKVNSKEIALMRAHFYNIPIILGSATPSLSSIYNVQRHNWKMFSITKRFAGSFPEIKKVILTIKDQKRRKNFWISQELEQAVKERLLKKEQCIIFINRRGFSFFVQCKACGFIFECSNCSVSLTLHQDKNTGSVLRCHYCDYSKILPHSCPGCSAPEKELLKKGIGTQQVVQIFKELFPQAIIERADLDSTKKKRAWQETVDLFSQGKIDILIGTQTITKGYHFPKVTLVGVLWADLNLHFPLYNASETTLQQLIQVAGRAGRACTSGQVIVQVMRDHPIFDYLNEQKYLDFCALELQDRQEAFYPPYARLACIELKHDNLNQIDHDAKKLVDILHVFNNKNELGVIILGPAYPIIQRIQNHEVRHIMLKSGSFKALHDLLAQVQYVTLESVVFFVVNQ